MPYNYGTGINDLGVGVGAAGSNLADLEGEYSGGCNIAWIWNPLTSAYSSFSVPGAANGTCPKTRFKELNRSFMALRS